MSSLRARVIFPGAFEGVLADGGLDAADVAVAEVFQPGGEPFAVVVQQYELQRWAMAGAGLVAT